MDWSPPFNQYDYADHFHTHGYALAERVFPLDLIETLKTAIESIPDGEAVRRKQNVYGVRNLLENSPEVRALAASEAARQFVTPILGHNAFATRAVFFDKVPQANWNLGWHQDSVISVTEQRDLPGFIAWVNKAGVWQVQPPAEILARMVAVRIHLDDCGPDNGPLRVIPGSHRSGWLDDHVEHWKQKSPPVTCCVPAGGGVVMSPLTLHASSKAESPSHRRVIHIEFAADNLPKGLDWNQRIIPQSPPQQPSSASDKPPHSDTDRNSG